MKTLPSKCPITPCPKAQALIEKYDLVYVGVGNDKNPLMPTSSTGIGLDNSGKIDYYLHKCWNGSDTGRHYFFSRAEVAKYYKPARVRKPVWTYFSNKGDTLYWVAKITDKTYRDYSSYGSNLGGKQDVEFCRYDIANGTYKTLTRAEFLAALKKFGLKEDGTKIAPKVPLPEAPARKVSPKPANHIVPKGYVYLGKSGEFEVGEEEKFFGYYLWPEERFNEGSGLTRPKIWQPSKNTGGRGYYYAPVNSKLARLNGLGSKPKKATLRDENARLTKEVETLKEELAKAKADISRARELATKIVELS